jgi:hypothetical protein
VAGHDVLKRRDDRSTISGIAALGWSVTVAGTHPDCFVRDWFVRHWFVHVGREGAR